MQKCEHLFSFNNIKYNGLLRGLSDVHAYLELGDQY